MTAWDKYRALSEARGCSRKDAALYDEQYALVNEAQNSLSYFTVDIDNCTASAYILDSDNYNEKTIISMPGEHFKCGGLVNWKNNFWLITECDPNDTLYTRAKMIQCNYLLKWVSDDRVVREQWCVIEDGTKYLVGEYEDRSFITTRGDTRLAMTIARNEQTLMFDRNCRFLIDDPERETKIAYQLTKPLKLGSVYGNEGVYKFVLQEVASTSYDNHLLGIADYYKHFPLSETGSVYASDANDGSNPGSETEPSDNTKTRKVWI